MATVTILSNATRWCSIIFNLTIMPIYLTSCGNSDVIEEPCCEETPIYHVIFEEPLEVFYNHAVSLDLNQDEVNDFSFTVTLFENGSDVNQVYSAVSLLDARIRLIDSKATPYEIDFTIEDESIGDPADWSIETGELITLTVKNDLSKSWSGPWKDNPNSYLALAIRVSGQFYNGWIKLDANMEEEKVYILEYAIETNPEKSIKTGQTE